MCELKGFQNALRKMIGRLADEEENGLTLNRSAMVSTFPQI